jgi:hypothetical protein
VALRSLGLHGFLENNLGFLSFFQVFVRRLKNTTFREPDLFPSSCEGGGQGHLLFGVWEKELIPVNGQNVEPTNCM